MVKTTIQQLPIYVLRKGSKIIKVIKCYDWVSNRFIFDLAQVRLGNLYGLIDDNGDEVLSPTYNYIGTPNSEGKANVRKGKLWGVYSYIEKREIIRPESKTMILLKCIKS